jgi:hypothetical protein
MPERIRADSIEGQYAILQPTCTMDVAQLLSLDMQVHAVSEEEYDDIMARYRGEGTPMWRFDADR